MDATGGYFELELKKGEHYHKNAIPLNTGRNCFEYVLRTRNYKKVFIPYYTCEVMLEPLHKLNIEYEFYHINQFLEPTDIIQLKRSEAFLYTNYYGLKQSCVEHLVEIFGQQLIVDNSQAFYAPRVQGIDTFYSPRKFFGVADGGYLYIDNKIDVDLEQDVSYNRMSHLLKRADVGAEFGFEDFHKNDSLLSNQPIMRMSNLTEKLLRSIDYEEAKEKRKKNYLYLNKYLHANNAIDLELNESIPMVYPFLSRDENLRNKMIEKKIFIATYWQNVTEWCHEDDMEYQLVRKLLPIPIDQRCEESDMDYIIKTLNNGK